jgi:hypothetical protein
MWPLHKLHVAAELLSPPVQRGPRQFQAVRLRLPRLQAACLQSDETRRLAAVPLQVTVQIGAVSWPATMCTASNATAVPEMA